MGEPVVEVLQSVLDFILDERKELKLKLEEAHSLINKYEEIIEYTSNACLCDRNTPGFDYNQKHPNLGKTTGRFKTPKDFIEDSVGFEWRYEKPVGVCKSWKKLNLIKYREVKDGYR